MAYSLGLDIGSVTVKLALTEDNGKILRLDSQRITAGAAAAANILLKRLKEQVSLDKINSAGVSGSGKSAVPKELGWAEYSSPLAIAAGLLNRHPDAKTIIQIGGQSSLVISLKDALKSPWQVASNPLCAAGTGRFLEQQAYRLGISLEELSNLALKCQDSPPRIAARCSVFAKTDLIHLQQKGVSVEAMLYGLCHSIARMVVSFKKSEIAEPVYFVGGVSQSAAVTKAINEVLSEKSDHTVAVTVTENSLYIEAIGCALLAAGKEAQVNSLPENNGGENRLTLPPLKQTTVAAVPTLKPKDGITSGYLGVDIGSTSTKAVVIDEEGEVLAKHYLMTAGQPLNAIKEVFRQLKNDAAGISISGVGATGSGRYLVGGFIGADLIRDEITAQTRAAAEIDNDADIIEIGGQDSKLVLKRNGVVVDYQMNKACAAGTGSFIDELAELLGVSVTSGQFAELAFSAPHTIDVGTRCAAFTSQAVSSARQAGVPLPVITASLANSIAENYLSKVVAHRKLGQKVILTGAVFYNQAIVAAFNQQLPQKQLSVAKHREVSGAIGAALLAKEEAKNGKTDFRGFEEVVEASYKLATFICKKCDNNCTITRMVMDNGRAAYYGSRCDRYDAVSGQAKRHTPFDEREKLLLGDYDKEKEGQPVVGIPRALLVYDYAPLLTGFLNHLGAKALFSSQTTKSIMERATQLSYSDSCFPLKLLHGHADSLKEADYILYPCALRLGLQEGAENQKYSCPLVQASPFIIRQALDLGDKLLTPYIDFSKGEAETIASLAETAVKIGFSRRKGKAAALAGISAQNRFEAGKVTQGEKLLSWLKSNGKTGVVIFARSYMAQDAGANLGIAEVLDRLGVVPVPLDFLPLDSVDVKKYTDRPYWSAESRHIAGAHIVASQPNLFGMVVPNFGCGPNSFVIREVEDIMSGKPLGQLEIDEHAAEAGIVTRLEAFVNTIKNYTETEDTKPDLKRIYRGSNARHRAGKKFITPRMCDHAPVIAAAMRAWGANIEVLPEPDQRNLLQANQITSGAECLPFRITLGDFMRYFNENGNSTKNIGGFSAGAYGPCRFGKYSIEQQRLLRELGHELPILTTVSNNGYRDLGLGTAFERLAWRGLVAVDHLQRLLWQSRPYEKEAGTADSLFKEYLTLFEQIAEKRQNFDKALGQAAGDFATITDRTKQRRPLVGINGEIYLRSNTFSNNDLARNCEEAGLEVVISPFGEWLNYTTHRNIEDAVKDKRLTGIIKGHIRKLVQERDERQVMAGTNGFFEEKEKSIKEVLARTSKHLSTRCGGEAVLSIGGGLGWLENPRFAGVISVMPHGCMPGGIVASMSEKLSEASGKPWISLTYDGFDEDNNQARINSFAEVLRFCCQPKQD